MSYCPVGDTCLPPDMMIFAIYLSIVVAVISLGVCSFYYWLDKMKEKKEK